MKARYDRQWWLDTLQVGSFALLGGLIAGLLSWWLDGKVNFGAVIGLGIVMGLKWFLIVRQERRKEVAK